MLRPFNVAPKLNFRAVACGGDIQSAILAFESEACVLILPHVQAEDRRRFPFGGEVGVDGDGVGGGVEGDAEEAAQSRRDDHGAGPELMAGRAAEGDEEVAREELGDGAGVLGPGEVDVLHEHLLAGEGLPRAVFGQGGPAGEEGPDGALMVAQAVVEGLGGSYVAETPVGV